MTPPERETETCRAFGPKTIAARLLSAVIIINLIAIIKVLTKHLWIYPQNLSLIKILLHHPYANFD